MQLVDDGEPAHDRMAAMRVTRSATTRLSLLVLAVASATGPSALAKPVEFTSRVAYEPLVAKLKAAGGSTERITRVQRVADLDHLESGRRYKFALDAHRQLAIAPLPADAAGNEYHHPILAGGGAVLTAGGIRIDRVGTKLTHVVVDQDSKAYCPTRESLTEVVRALTELGVPATVISTTDRPPQCTAP
jgi:hypothetical protein